MFIITFIVGLIFIFAGPWFDGQRTVGYVLLAATVVLILIFGLSMKAFNKFFEDI